MTDEEVKEVLDRGVGFVARFRFEVKHVETATNLEYDREVLEYLDQGFEVVTVFQSPKSPDYFSVILQRRALS
jgi:hypothetical protein